MIYFYINKIDNKYYLMDSRPSYDFSLIAPDCLMCGLQELDVTDALKKHGSVLGYVAEERFDSKTVIAGCKAYKEKEVDVLISRALEEYMAEFSGVDVNTWFVQEHEAEKYSSSNGNYTSEILTNIANLKGKDVSELVPAILEKAGKHKIKLFDFKSCKDHVNKRLNDFKTLEEFDGFKSEEEIEYYFNNLKAVRAATVKENEIKNLVSGKEASVVRKNSTNDRHRAE